MKAEEIRYEVIEHTADFAFEIQAPDFHQLLRLAVLAVVDAGWGLETVEPGHSSHKFTVPAQDREMAIFLALSEALYLIDALELIPGAVKIQSANGDGLDIQFDCDQLDLERHSHHMAFKAVTLHGLQVDETEDGLKATILMDI
ncbi:MAG TPA: archease [Myxococcota bacterium]|nr:archease [Myxococcota bacterium]